MAAQDEFNLAGLLDVNFTIIDAIATAASTTYGLRITTDYGQGILDEQTVDGLVAASFDITNITTAATITPNSVTEVLDDKYSFDIPNQTSSDVIRTKMVTNTGYDGFIDQVAP